MKKIFLSLLISYSVSAQQYTVDFNIENMRWGNHETWKCDLTAQVYVDGSPVDLETMGTYFYQWQTTNITGDWFS